MASVFTKMLAGETPARFVWRDERCAAIISPNPIKPGHCVLFPREEVGSWLELTPDLAGHLFAVAQKVGGAIQTSFQPVRVGLAIISIVTPHVHVHLVPINTPTDLDFSKQDIHPQPVGLEEAAEKIRNALR